MVGIVALKESPVDFINAGLTAREQLKDGKRVKLLFIGKEDVDGFWKKLQDYVDPKDKMLIIINVPLPAQKDLENMASLAWEAAIIYVPSKLISLDRDRRDLLLERGISCVPQREPFQCFPSDPAESDTYSEFWMNIGKVLSIEEIPGQIEKKTSQAIRALLMSTKDPRKVVEGIASEKEDFFANLEAKALPVEVQVNDDNTLIEVVSDNRGSEFPNVAYEAFDAFLRTRIRSIGVCGKDKSALFTVKPTLTQTLLKKCKVRSSIFYNLGKAAIFSLNERNPAHVSVLVGRESGGAILIRFDDPRFVSYRTLKRRLIGGMTRARIGGKVYRKTYRGLKDKYCEMQWLGRNLLEVPQDSFEAVVDTLNECGAEFSFWTSVTS